MSRLNSFFFVVLLQLSHSAYGGWDTSSVRTLAGDCFITEGRVDDTKLTWHLERFALSTGVLSALRHEDSSRCTVMVDFVLEPNTKLSLLTHRVVASATKDANTELSLNARIQLESESFSVRGVLPFGTRFSDRVLLYKSFDVANLIGCSDTSQRVTVGFEWLLDIKTSGATGSASISLTDGDGWTDTWLSTQQCVSAGPLTLEKGAFDS